MPLTRLWTGMRTWATNDAETESPIVLIINDNGQDDLLHYTFPDSSQDDQERGRSNLYEVPVADPVTITPGNLQPSSIRVGIRGDDAWAAEDFFVFGEENGSPIPLALARTINKTLSANQSDAKNDDARLSIPIPPVILGDSKTDIFGLIVLMLTGADGTDSPVELRIKPAPPQAGFFVGFIMPTPSPDPNSAQGKQFHQKKDQASFYYVGEETGSEVSPFKKSGLDGSSITLRLQGADSWLPARFFIFGIGTRDPNEVPVTLVPLVHIPDWTLGKLEGAVEVTLPLV